MGAFDGKRCLRQGAAVAAALWISLTPANAAAEVQIEASADVFESAGVQRIRAQIAALTPTTRDLNAQVTIGAEAFQAAINREDGRPIVATYLTSTEFSAALRDRSPEGRVTAIFSNPDPVDQLSLARALLGPAKVAVFDSPAVHSLVTRLTERGVVTAIPVTPNEGIDRLLRSTDSFDVILVLPDLSVLNRTNIGHVVRTLYQEHKVLIGYSDTLVQVGSLASVYPDAEAIARNVRDALERLAHQHSLPAPSFVSDVEISLNERLARSLNIVLPDKADLLAALRSQHGAPR